jgi:hypothetical protein
LNAGPAPHPRSATRSGSQGFNTKVAKFAKITKEVEMVLRAKRIQ